jgi:hypothetical protein
MLSGCELIDTENISLSRQNMKFGGELAKGTNHIILPNCNIYLLIP